MTTIRTGEGARIVRGYSIQGGTIYDHLGEVWGVYDTHVEAMAAVEAYKAGLASGKALGAKEAQRKILDALGLV